MTKQEPVMRKAEMSISCHVIEMKMLSAVVNVLAVASDVALRSVSTKYCVSDGCHRVQQCR